MSLKVMLLNRDAKNKLQQCTETKATYPKHIYWAPTLGQILVARDINMLDDMIPVLKEFIVTFLSLMSD